MINNLLQTFYNDIPKKNNQIPFTHNTSLSVSPVVITPEVNCNSYNLLIA